MASRLRSTGNSFPNAFSPEMFEETIKSYILHGVFLGACCRAEQMESLAALCWPLISVELPYSIPSQCPSGDSNVMSCSPSFLRKSAFLSGTTPLKTFLPLINCRDRFQLSLRKRSGPSSSPPQTHRGRRLEVSDVFPRRGRKMVPGLSRLSRISGQSFRFFHSPLHDLAKRSRQAIAFQLL